MKKILLSLFVGFVGIISFCSAGSYTISGQLVGYIGGSNIPIPLNVYSNNGTSKPRVYYTCSFSCDDIYANMKLYKVVGGAEFGIGSYFHCNTTQVFSLEATAYLIRLDGGSSSYVVNYVCTITGDNIGSTCPTCPEINTGAILSGYVPESQLTTCENNYNSCQSDLNSCQSNTSGFNDQLNNCNLSLNACNSSLTNCLQYNCPEIDYTGDLQYSNLYINDILHPGKQNIFVNIPDYITWDYNFTGDDFNLDVGSGYDVDYIESVIDINSYRPTSEDFTNVFVSGLTLVMPYIVIALFIIFVRKLLKRIFK